jgi:acetylornithine/succinyldiaminopimelate/putrescine aminotransferase
MPIPPPGYLEQARRLCDQSGALLILDEIQAGLGRTGRLWAFEHFDVRPDMLVIGKGLSGGLYPMAATCMSAACEVVFHDDPFIHISTFGGAEVACPLALQVLTMSSEPAFLQHVHQLAAQFAEGFVELRARHPRLLVRLRQLGLMMGIEMAHPLCGPLWSKAAYDHGFLSVYAYNDTRVAQFLPPLLIDQALAAELLERVDAALGQVAAMLGNDDTDP